MGVVYEAFDRERGTLARLSIRWGMLGLASSTLFLSWFARALQTFSQGVGAVSTRPLLEFISLPLLVAGCLYQVFSHAHAGFLARYPRFILTPRGFTIAAVNDTLTQLLLYAWLGLMGSSGGPVRLLVLSGAMVHILYLIALVVVPRWFLYEVSNLGAATLRELDGPQARPRWKRLFFATSRYVMVWIDSATHMVGLLALLTVVARRGAWTPLGLGLVLGVSGVLLVFCPPAARMVRTNGMEQ